MTITIDLMPLSAVVITGFVVIWLLFYAPINTGYFKPVRLSIAIITLVWIIYGVLK